MTHKMRLYMLAATIIVTTVALGVIEAFSIELPDAVYGGLVTAAVGALAGWMDAFRVRSHVIDDPEVRERLSTPEESENA